MSTLSERARNAFIENIDGPISSYFASCVHCGLCAEACLFYTETKDPKYTPIYKLELMKRVWSQEFTLAGKIKKTLGLSKNVSEKELEEWEPLIYDSCTMCGRCTMVCPVGNDITHMISKAREAFVASGYAPKDLKTSTKRAVTAGSPMGITEEGFNAVVKNVEKEVGIKIPVNKEGVDYLVLLSSAEMVIFPEFIESVEKIFRLSGLSWTLSSKSYEATNPGIQIGSKDMAGTILKKIVDEAEKLKVKTVVTPECGHAYHVLRWSGPNILNRNFNFEVMHILEIIKELLDSGKIKLKGKVDTPMTLHDPCQIVRRGGLINEPQELLDSVASNFQRTSDQGLMNWCCGGGGGVSANERAEDLRIKSFGKKRDQLKALDNVFTLVSACSNCRTTLEEGLEEHHLDMEVLSLTDLIAENLVE